MKIFARWFYTFDVLSTIRRPLANGKCPSGDENLWTTVLTGDHCFAIFEMAKGAASHPAIVTVKQCEKNFPGSLFHPSQATANQTDGFWVKQTSIVFKYKMIQQEIKKLPGLSWKPFLSHAMLGDAKDGYFKHVVFALLPFNAATWSYDSNYLFYDFFVCYLTAGLPERYCRVSFEMETGACQWDAAGQRCQKRIVVVRIVEGEGVDPSRKCKIDDFTDKTYYRPCDKGCNSGRQNQGGCLPDSPTRPPFETCDCVSGDKYVAKVVANDRGNGVCERSAGLTMDTCPTGTPPGGAGGGGQYCKSSDLCLWDQWTQWTPCTSNCGVGQSSRTIKALNADKTQQCLHGTKSMTAKCSSYKACSHCQILYETTSAWSTCTATCGSSGTQTRKIKTVYKGTDKDGICSALANGTDHIRPCPNEPCPENCVFHEWTDWSECSNNCGDGTQTRKRNLLQTCVGENCVCVQPPEMHQTKNCKGKYRACPTDCTWSDWYTTAQCPKCAKLGQQYRRIIRRDITVDASYGGQCPGEPVSSTACSNLISCDDSADLTKTWEEQKATFWIIAGVVGGLVLLLLLLALLFLMLGKKNDRLSKRLIFIRKRRDQYRSADVSADYSVANTDKGRGRSYAADLKKKQGSKGVKADLPLTYGSKNKSGSKKASLPKPSHGRRVYNNPEEHLKDVRVSLKTAKAQSTKKTKTKTASKTSSSPMSKPSKSKPSRKKY